jgi:hypothetical protein
MLLDNRLNKKLELEELVIFEQINRDLYSLQKKQMIEQYSNQNAYQLAHIEN